VITSESSIAFVLDHEGGYGNDPQDSGGETNFGLSKRSYPHLDIKSLTRPGAAAIYWRDFWTPMRCGELPPIFGAALFDAAVNEGPHAAVVLLQAALGVPVDGVLGPRTLAAVRVAGRSLLMEFLARRILQYAASPKFGHDGKGWIRRVLDLEAFCLIG
jgi:lysozyme family protein